MMWKSKLCLLSGEELQIHMMRGLKYIILIWEGPSLKDWKQCHKLPCSLLSIYTENSMETQRSFLLYP
jgi:hypothetical protein